MQKHFRRTVLGLELFICLMVLGTLCLLLLSVYRNAERFRPVERHIEYVTTLRGIEEAAEAAFGRSVSAGAAVSPGSIDNLRSRILALHQMDAHLDKATPGRLRRLEEYLGGSEWSGAGRSERFLAVLGETIDAEIEARQTVLQSISSALRGEERLMTLLAAAVPLILLGAMIMFRLYVVAPARRIAGLLTDLGGSRFDVVDIGEATPVMRPILENYNRLVTRLGQLESERHQKQATLERQVHIASGSLMRLQRTLANAEKLAVVGEIAAGIAHELRNPLAGIRAALDNLRLEMHQADHQARLSLVLAELKRMTALLNHLLEQTGVAPEIPVEVHIANAVDEVAQLAKFQLPETISIEQKIDRDLSVTLPEDRFRQAMLNLILNSAQVIGKQAGEIEIIARRTEDHVEISITDSGPGFPGEVLESGPLPFFSQRERGTGLGLATVRRLARDLGGRLIIANVKPHGARVTLEFPCGGGHGR